MKFLCDRCKTRYSIGDDRVRGKILKIRCKNCANVITVREGMTDADAADASAPRRTVKPTTISPPVSASVPASRPAASNGAPGAAAAATKPPPALEEEWYVSIDGDQEGPFSLTDAQRWISRKAIDADLHCWSEGFDDWLPVDKVSHFRGLRKRPQPATSPPPLPRATGAVPALRAQPRPAVEDEPKPLFAATMASLEKSAAQASVGLGMPPPGNSLPRPAATPSAGQPRYPSPLRGTPAIPSIQARTNGTGPARVPAVIPAPAPAPAIAKPSKSGPVPRAETRPGLGGAFDIGNDQATQIESPAFDLEAQTHAEPVASQAKRQASEGGNDAFFKSLGRESGPTTAMAPSFDGPTTAPAALPIPTNPHGEAADDDEDDGLSIGEVSRVVKLADLAKSAPKPKRAETATPSRGTMSNPALSRTGAVAKLGGTAQVARIDDPRYAANGAFLPGADPSVAPGSELAMQPAPAPTSHKKGLIILIGVAGLLLAGVVVAVVMLAGGGDTTNQGLGSGEKIDTTRPDDPLRPRQPNDTGPGSATAVNPFFPPKNPNTWHPKNPNTNPGNQTGSAGSAKDPNEPLTGDSLTPEDIDTVSKKYSSGTQRCYMRSQKGVDAITIGNVKSIQATLTVSKDGLVTEVSLATHADDNLGRCLTSALHAWRFRTNPGGRIKFTLAFASG